jgi:hypothetical protein
MDNDLIECKTPVSQLRHLVLSPHQSNSLATPLKPRLHSLPPELLEQIASALVRQTQSGPPSCLIGLIVLNSRFYDILGPSNHGFYSDLFKERFDWKSVQRRWNIMGRIEDKREKRSLLLEVIQVKADVDLVLNPAGSFTRSNSPNSIMDFLSLSTSTWRPLTSKDLAIEFKRRCTVLTKMRRASLSGIIPPSSSRPNSPRPSSPRLTPMTPTESFRLPLADPDELTQNLWTCYLMLLENGRLNGLCRSTLVNLTDTFH